MYENIEKIKQKNNRKFVKFKYRIAQHYFGVSGRFDGRSF